MKGAIRLRSAANRDGNGVFSRDSSRARRIEYPLVLRDGEGRLLDVLHVLTQGLLSPDRNLLWLPVRVHGV